MHLTSFSAALCNAGALVLGQPATNRALYHMASYLLWTWQSLYTTVGEPSTLIDRTVLPLVYALAFLLDILTGSISKVEFHSRFAWTEMLEWATCAWLNPILLAKTALEPPTLPDFDFGTPEHFKDYQASFFGTCARPRTGPFKAYLFFLVKNHASTLSTSAFLRLIDDMTKLTLPFQLRSLLAGPTMPKILVLLCSRIVGSICVSMANIRLREIGVCFKGMISAALHDKTLRLGVHRTSKDLEISTLSEVDSQALFGNTMVLHDFWSYPTQSLFTLLGLLYLLPWEGVVAVLLFTVR
jgi:hypothetical protein